MDPEAGPLATTCLVLISPTAILHIKMIRRKGCQVENQTHLPVVLSNTTSASARSMQFAHAKAVSSKHHGKDPKGEDNPARQRVFRNTESGSQISPGAKPNESNIS